MALLFKKFSVAFKGLIIAFKDKSIGLQGIISILVILFGFVYKFRMNEWMWILSCIVLVLLTEMINTCIEKICDLIDLNLNDKIKYIKDLSAGSVLLASIYAIVIGCMVLGGVLR